MKEVLKLVFVLRNTTDRTVSDRGELPPRIHRRLAVNGVNFTRVCGWWQQLCGDENAMCCEHGVEDIEHVSRDVRSDYMPAGWARRSNVAEGGVAGRREEDVAEPVAEAAHDGEEDQCEIDGAYIAVVGKCVEVSELGLKVGEKRLERGCGILGDGYGSDKEAFADGAGPEVLGGWERECVCVEDDTERGAGDVHGVVVSVEGRGAIAFK